MAVSPYLDGLLTRWIARGHDLRKEAAFQKDLIDPLALAAHGNRLAMRERRRRDLQHVEENAVDSWRRWDERLNRIEEWKRAVHSLDQEQAHLRALLGAARWLEKARRHQPLFSRRIERGVAAVHERQQVFHQKLLLWQAALTDREENLQQLTAKERAMLRPFLVSRARKRPETDFAQTQQVIGEILGKELQQLRRSLNHWSGRLTKAFQSVDQRASAPQILYEVHKQEIVSGLRGSERGLRQLRDQIMGDALHYEACRSAVRRIHEQARHLRCIEDYPQRRPAGWKRFFA